MASQIDPNNIDGSYPVAGQDNNSQGFRDNFTNIKTNFQYTEDEINDLQAKVLLKSALTGTTLDNNMGDNLIYAGTIRDFGFTKVTPTQISNTWTLNYSAGHYQSITTTGITNILAFTNFPTSGTYGYIKLQIVLGDPTHVITLPTGVTYLGTSGIQGYAAGPPATITFSAAGTYELAFGTYNTGTTITVFDLNRALTNFSGADLSIDDITATGNVTANTVGKFASFATVQAGAAISATGNITGGNLVSGGLVTVTGNITGGNLRTGGQVSATGNVNANYLNAYVRPTAGGTSAGTSALQFAAGSLLATAAAGSFEFDGTAFYTTQTAGQRGALPPTIYQILSADYTGADVNTAQKVFNASPNGALTVDGSTTYAFEAIYYITRAAGTTSHTTSVLFGGNATLTSITYRAEATSSTGNTLTAPSVIYGTAGTALIVTGASTSASENIVVKLEGIIRTNGSGTVIPQFQYSAAPGGAPTILKNSYIMLRPVNNSSTTYVGNWS